MGMTIALAGNPNSGKTSLFNALTGARQHVGNYPGVTVEKKSGVYEKKGRKVVIVDLPGTYSLTAYSPEEVAARDFLVREKPHMVVNIVDASNLERHLYLTVQIMEMGVPVCLALNMIDVAKNRGIEIKADKLSELLGIPVVPTIARSGKGKEELMETVSSEEGLSEKKALNISYGSDLDLALKEMEALISSCKNVSTVYGARWAALKFLENDSQIIDGIRSEDGDLFDQLKKISDRVSGHLRKTLNTSAEAIIADYRYGFISSVLKEGVLERKYDENRLYMSDKIDKVLVNRAVGPAIMAAVLFGLYYFTFALSEVPVGWLEDGIAFIGDFAETHMADGLLKSLVVSGIIDGVGGVLGFAPLIMFMFFGISILEDSGYLARVAYMLDRVFRVFGLHGSSVMAFIVSGGIAGGCAVPGVMASRTLKSPKERLATLLTVPFMNCGAKIPVFALLVGAFFSKNEAVMMMVITVISWLGALITAKILRMTLIRGQAAPFVMELPPYRFPTLKGLLIHTYERTFQYVKKAGTTILGISIILWALMTFPGLPDSEKERFEIEKSKISTSSSEYDEAITALEAEENSLALRYSIAGRMGLAIEKVTSFAGFDWRTNIALVGGFAAKEVVVSTLATAYSMENTDPEEQGPLKQVLAASPNWSQATALSLIIFTIFYAPCFVTVVCIIKETGSFKWGLFSMVFNTSLAFVLATMVYQTARFMGY